MSYQLVPLAQVKAQLGYASTVTSEDAKILWRLQRVSAAIMDYLKSKTSEAIDGTWTDSDGEPLVDSNGDPTPRFETDSDGDYVLDSNGDQIQISDSCIPEVVEIATIVAMEEWSNNRAALLITPAVESVLRRSRDPALA